MADVVITGPLLTGQAPAAVRAILNEAVAAVATVANASVHLHMNAFFKHPTPYYETQVIPERRGDSIVVHDRGVIYGPWLAGVGSRNSTSRFKGYAHWRLATQEATAKAPSLVETVIRTNMGRLS